MLGIEHDEVEAGCTYHFDECCVSGEALDAERDLLLLEHR
jgi:hypothetical protein